MKDGSLSIPCLKGYLHEMESNCKYHYPRYKENSRPDAFTVLMAHAAFCLML